MRRFARLAPREELGVVSADAADVADVGTDLAQSEATIPGESVTVPSEPTIPGKTTIPSESVSDVPREPTIPGESIPPAAEADIPDSK